ncbi:family 16 glycosylhydrolase, partial [Pseudokineococcus basanitobsidens]
QAPQQWDVRADGTIRALGKCLDAASGGTADGTRVQLWTCNGSGAQRWAVSGARDVVNVQADKCLDATGPSSADRTPLQLWTCSGQPNQKWTTPAVGGGTPARRLVFADEFDGGAGTGVDASRWNQEVDGGGGGNGELQYYTAGTANTAMDGAGHLVITARKGSGGHQCWYGTCQYTSGRLTTQGKFTTTYGRIESRIQVPKGQGVWPAFWMLGADLPSNPWPGAGEIDVMENIGREPRTVHGTLHGPGYSGGESIGAPYVVPGGAAVGDAFHTFAVDWSPNRITWSVDGVEYQTRTPSDLGGDRWVYDKPFFLLLNLAVGGQWPGSPDASTPFPAQMKVDYVRVYAG